MATYPEPAAYPAGAPVAQPVAQPQVIVAPPGAEIVVAPPPGSGQAGGLQILQAAHGLFVRQKAQWFEEFTGFEQANKYQLFLKNAAQTTMTDEDIKHLPRAFTAVEESGCFERQCLGGKRGFHMDILDMNKQPVLKMERECQCTCLFQCCCVINPEKIRICTPEGALYGTVTQKVIVGSLDWAFDVQDGLGNNIYEIRASCCQLPPNCICERWEATIFNTAGQAVGNIANVWPGCTFKLLSKADNFEINFTDPTMPYNHKAILLGVIFLIDFMFFEKQDEQH